MLLACCTLAVWAGNLHQAVKRNSPEAIKAILETGADINKLNEHGQTPLMYGILMGSTEGVKALLDAGADKTINEKDDYNPLDAAAFQGRADIVKELLAHGFDVDGRHGSDGHTPLQRACWGPHKRHTDTVKVLLEAGASEEGINDSHSIDGLDLGNSATKEVLRKHRQQKESKQAKHTEL